MDGPLFTWKPEMPDPDCDALAYAVRTRSERSETRRVTVYTASRKAQKHFGGYGIFKPDQAAHDSTVSEVYTWYLINEPELAALWRGEDVDFSRGKRETHPDAFLPGRIIEVLGSYPVIRIRRLVSDARTRKEEIELW